MVSPQLLCNDFRPITIGFRGLQPAFELLASFLASINLVGQRGQLGSRPRTCGQPGSSCGSGDFAFCLISVLGVRQQRFERRPGSRYAWRKRSCVERGGQFKSIVNCMALCRIGFGSINGEQLAFADERHDRSSAIRRAQFDKPILGCNVCFPCNNDLPGYAGESSAGPHPLHYLNDNLHGALGVARFDVVAERAKGGLIDSLPQLLCRGRIEVGLTREVRQRVGQKLCAWEVDDWDPNAKLAGAQGCKRRCLGEQVYSGQSGTVSEPPAQTDEAVTRVE